jgi:hypothetical protein
MKKGAPQLDSKSKCATCGHHKRDHTHPMGCNRCQDQHQHKYLSPAQAEGLIDEHPDFADLPAFPDSVTLPIEEFDLDEDLPPHIILQARLYALDMAVKAYDLYTEMTDEVINPEWIDRTATRYTDFLLKGFVRG